MNRRQMKATAKKLADLKLVENYNKGSRGGDMSGAALKNKYSDLVGAAYERDRKDLQYAEAAEGPTRFGPRPPLSDIFDGIQFRNKSHKDLLLQRIGTLVARLESDVEYRYRMLAAEKEKAADVQIEHLKNALELEQARHRADIINHASGRNPMRDVLGADHG